MKPAFLGLAFVLAISTFSVGQDYKSYDEGIARFRAQDFQGVIEIYSKVLADPDHNKRLNPDLYFYRGQAFCHLNRPEESLADLKEALTLNHYNKAVISWYFARCNALRNAPSEAERYYAEALNFAQKNKKVTARILAERAAWFAARGMKAEAQQDLASARSIDPGIQVAGVPSSGPVQQNPQSRGQGTEQKTTKVIVKGSQGTPGNTKTEPETPAAQKTKSAEPQQSTNSSVDLVATLADVYKDEKRYALVIGNSNYPKEIGVLKNPVNDATDVATELRNSNFEVQLLTNATYIQIREAMRKFQEKLVSGPKDQTVGLFYYAGHGVQYQDENYLVPVDANVKFEDDIVRMCFPVQRMVLNNMEKTNSRMNIIILDACRNNPFPATTRSMSQGLGEMKRARGSFIAYATAPGSVASDGNGRNGLYTQELLKALRKPGLTIEQVFKEVRMNVLKFSDERQYTWDSSNIIGEFYFKF